ncbi:NAD(P)H-dependent glycerol-3-phosphate dehydrogenase [Desulfuribacillus alkaliarsenatis]|uniref:Glycerol-3-phosphate dehydrogenase [NAD(P)+] n=1 Tax=Desulfuribacillus alkaliarsenatis TaxID=766136 RepID=A0A1E5FZL5_9FIRM|nr:NAD(P)H-dependent glycerol-3-phosphate dehydrogenase [Desulfuribacillus alkaliarsenatis]OEF96021.1 glycerol-3-phosphate dehydrogenase [Desulfuribacillus alkaliarsenatis]
MNNEVVVIGAGSWGTALSLVLAENKNKVTLWTRTSEHAAFLNKHHINPKYLKDVKIPDSVIATSDLEQAVKGKKFVVLVTPSHSLEKLLPEINQYITNETIIIHAIKGIDPVSLKRVSEIILECLPNLNANRLAVLSGPSHAEEVALKKPTTVVIASAISSTAEHAQDLFINKHFRVYTNTDVIGVELGGALKNIIALGAGISDGLGFGDNAKAALMTRGLTEITRLGVYLGAEPTTFSGLAGIGDLIVTCTSIHSRNYRAGKLIGLGNSLEETLEQMEMVVEGVRTTKAAYILSQKNSVDMPITSQLYKLLFENKDAKEAVEDLMARVKKDEHDDYK